MQAVFVFRFEAEKVSVATIYKLWLPMAVVPLAVTTNSFGVGVVLRVKAAGAAPPPWSYKVYVIGMLPQFGKTVYVGMFVFTLASPL